MTSPEPVLSRSVVDRASARRTDPGWLAAAWRDRGHVLRLDAALTVPVADGLEWERTAGALPAHALFLGEDDGGAWFAVDEAAAVDDGPVHADDAIHSDEPASTRRAGLRDVGAQLGDRDAGLLVHAVALATWHRRHPRCPRCGAMTVPEAGGSTRRCTADGSEHFPRTDPAMIVLVTDPAGDLVLLGRAAQWPPRRFSCLAGFVEPGESAEQSVVREVAEEVGLTAGGVRYVASQPWPFPASLMLGFTAVVAGPPRPEPVVDVAEIAEARWFDRDELRAALADGTVLAPPPVSIARLLIDGWLDEVPDPAFRPAVVTERW